MQEFIIYYDKSEHTKLQLRTTHLQHTTSQISPHTQNYAQCMYVFNTRFIYKLNKLHTVPHKIQCIFLFRW